jgi:urease accessory protein
MTITSLPHPTAKTDVLKSAACLGQPPVHLSLRIAWSGSSHGNAESFIARQYATYPFRLSGNLPIDSSDPHRVYAYIMNVSPGLLSGDDLRLALQLCDRTHLYLTDQSATKVHSCPAGSDPARVHWSMEVGNQAYLEYIPEPVILFPAAAFNQHMQITLHPQGQLVLSEILVPGRLARGEYYQFDQFQSRLRVQTPEGQLCFADHWRLEGQTNPLKHSPFLKDYPILGNFMVVVPGVALPELMTALQAYKMPLAQLRVGVSTLPNCNGVLVRAIATQVSDMQPYQRYLVNCVRQLTHQPPLPYIPK